MNQYERFARNVKVELDLSNYGTKADPKGETGIDTSTPTSKTDLASLKTKVENLDVDKFKFVHANLSKLNNVVDNDVVKRTAMNWLPKSMLLILRYQTLVD